MDKMYNRYMNNNNPILDISVVSDTMLPHVVSYDTTIWHIDLDGNMNNKGVYKIFTTGKIRLLYTAIRFSNGRGMNLK